MLERGAILRFRLARLPAPVNVDGETHARSSSSNPELRWHQCLLRNLRHVAR